MGLVPFGIATENAVSGNAKFWIVLFLGVLLFLNPCFVYFFGLLWYEENP